MKRFNFKTAAALFLTFFKIGAFTFGGGYAMIPLIQKEICDRKKWLTDNDISDIIAVAESTPGPVAVNAATFAGYKTAGFWGAFSATLGIIIPSFVMIVILSFFINTADHLQFVKYAFTGIRAGILALIIKAFYTMYKANSDSIISAVFLLGSFAAVCLFHANTFFVLACCALIGLFHTLYILRRDNK